MPEDEPFSVDLLLAMPRVAGLALSPDGARLVTSVARPDRSGKRFVTALWELDPAGAAPPRRLTRSAPGESTPAFLPDGSLLFTSARPDPDADKDDPRGEAPALWLLPAGRGEAYLLAAPPGGVDTVKVAGDAGTIVFTAAIHPGATTWKDDAEREKARVDKGVAAQLFTEYPIRYWDAYLGPRQRHLCTADAPAEDRAIDDDVVDLVPDPGRGLDNATYDVTPDGGTVVTTRWRDVTDLRRRTLDLVAVDVATLEQRVLAADDAWYDTPACSPDGRWVVAVREALSTPERAGDHTLWLVDLATGEGRDLLSGFDRWPQAPVWAPDASAVYFVADDGGRTLPFRVELSDGTVTRLASDGAYSDLCPTPDGRTVYALRSLVTSPPHPAVLDARAADQQPKVLEGAWGTLAMPGTLERISATAADGTAVHGWLLLPPDAAPDRPAPLTVLVHGGPVGSWTGWHWRWNPHVFAARGFAVLLPDPAISTGYGIDYIQRGWGRWGDVVYGDVLTLVDAAVARRDVDGDRTAVLGGSFGGYMANWIAGHTDRFAAIVTHASLWALEQFHGTTDLGVWWEREFGDPYVDPARYRANSPHTAVANIRTPVLVVHGELDHRVPISEALRLWTDLRRHGVTSQFLYFPDETHWISKPNNARVWYETVCAFLDAHVLGGEWQRPALL